MIILKRKVESVEMLKTAKDISNALEEFCNGEYYNEKDINTKYGVFVKDPLHPKYGVVLKVYVGHLYYTYYQLERVKPIIQNTAESMDDYYNNNREMEADAKRILLNNILNIRGRTGNIIVNTLPISKDTFFSNLRKSMNNIREEIEFLVDQNIDFVIDYWKDIHDYNN